MNYVFRLVYLAYSCLILFVERVLLRMYNNEET